MLALIFDLLVISLVWLAGMLAAIFAFAIIIWLVAVPQLLLLLAAAAIVVYIIHAGLRRLTG